MNVTRIGLSKLFLWVDADRLQSYPAAFARIEGERIYSMQELVTDVFGIVYKDLNMGRVVCGDMYRNALGLYPGPADGKVQIKGINAFQKKGGNGLKAHPKALEIGRIYRESVDEDAWLIPMAKMLAMYEVRTRLMLHLLGEQGYMLTARSCAFMSEKTSWVLLQRDDEVHAIFDKNGEAFNALLAEHRSAALGPWWRQEIEEVYGPVDEDFRFEGLRDGPPSVNGLGTALKCSLRLFHYLGLITAGKGGWILNEQKCRQVLGSEITEGLLGPFSYQPQQRPVHVLRELVAEMEDAEGYAAVEPLARSWAGRQDIAPNHACTAFDDFIRGLEFERAIRIVSRHRGQPRLGRGLYGDDEARKIRIAFQDSRETERNDI